VQPILEVADMVAERQGSWSVALPSLVLCPGEVAALYGPSGCGKSTLLRSLLGLPGAAPVVRGARRLLGRDLASLGELERRAVWRTDALFLPQGARAALDPLRRVLPQVALATGADRADIVGALAALGASDAPRWLDAFPHRLSGGEAQRTLLATALLRRPRLVVADEPTADLDDLSRRDLLRALGAMRTNGAALLLATHDHALLHELGARVFAWHGDHFAPGEFDVEPWPRRDDAASESRADRAVVLRARGLAANCGGRCLFAELDLELRAGDLLVVAGDSGSGKSTLARLLAGHEAPTAGQVERTGRGGVQLVCQDAQGSLTPGRTLADLCAEVGVARELVAATAARLQLPAAILDRRTELLSGGEARRAALLRAVVAAPSVLILDEPTNGLDRRAAAALLEVVQRERRDRGCALVVITHDRSLAAAIADQTLNLPC
jgi:peptide/nickel transport system ATP-binding protein